MTVTKQQQLEWMASKWVSWPAIDCYVVMSGYHLGCSGWGHCITKVEWQQERDKLMKQQEVEQDSSWHERGDYPPVGCECEFAPMAGGAWIKTTILAITNQNVILLPNGESVEFVFRLSNVIFRPLRTERENALIDMKIVSGVDTKFWNSTLKPFAELLYDEGWRKP